MTLSNLSLRFLTSIILFPIIFFMIFYNKVIYLLLLIFVFCISTLEFVKVIKKKNFYLNFFGFFVIFLSIFSAYFLRGNIFETKIIFLWIIITCFFSDIGGYYFGKIFGKRKITKISPNKTYAGSIGSFLFSLLPIIIFSFFNLEIELLNLSIKTIFLSLLFSLFCQIGDVFFSYFKRINNVKDYGKMLPGHGGLLDRIDGLLFVIILSEILRNLNFI